MWTALLLAAASLAPAHSNHALDEEAWLARLHPPKLTKVDFTVHWRADLSGTDFGFPADPEERLEGARQRIDAGARDGHVLLQALTALYRLERIEDIKRMLPACLAAYDRELEATPADVLLSIGKSRVLSMIGTLSGDDQAFRDARALLASAREHEPDNALLAMDALLLTLTRITVGHRRGSFEDAWFDEAVSHARRAIDLAPTATGPRFGLFQARQARGVACNDLAILQREVEAGAQELLEAADALELEDAATVRLAGRGFLFMAAALPRLMQGMSDEEIAPLDERLTDTMAAFAASLEDSPQEGELASQVLRAFWALQCIAGDLDTHDARLGAVSAAGLDRELVLGFATATLLLRGEADRARKTAATLAEEATSDAGRAMLAAYFFKVHEPANALSYVEQLSGTSAAHGGARAVAQLLLGQTAAALDSCAEAARCEDVSGELAGDLAHARGVALALLGRLEEAEEALAIASRILVRDEGVAETLAEVRALR